MYVGVFTIVKGVFFLGVSLGLFLLDRDLKQKMVWKTTSRLPEIEKHEQVVFKQNTLIQPEFDLHNLHLRKQTKPSQPKQQTKSLSELKDE
jgi:hypothetical protein